ncbi:hypothetical protein [Mariprofundus ferrooxydans]|jgi:hypothetical protein|uniref:Uncharacterized protein n=1 Tax=Mariprofundus ferrooxydans PV-1 TaxID=314345 RepID=Q0F387_9PROT|nr:hypothetical protein [Mariprofundus ferrooxydans]EAU56054.1 hypothetical protein SPV1_04518 [Mariprofundus ferrooxydans PV-1]KON46640.1 hypothetical protein AL013_12045 [Mariprofundus ferrooxydans]
MKELQILVRGGLVQAALSGAPEDFKDIKVVIVDYDVSDTSATELTPVGDGDSVAYANVYEEKVGQSNITIG